MSLHHYRIDDLITLIVSFHTKEMAKKRDRPQWKEVGKKVKILLMFDIFEICQLESPVPTI